MNKIDNQNKFIKSLGWRYATKKFDGSTISDEEITNILEAIELSPTSYGLQPFHVKIIKSQEVKEMLKPLAWNQEQINTCSHLFVFCAKQDVLKRINEYFSLLSDGDTSKRAEMKPYEDMMKGFASNMDVKSTLEWSKRQAYIPLGIALAYCAEYGIDSCPMEGFDSGGFKKALKIEEDLNPVVLLAVGKRDPGDKPRPKFRFPTDEMFDFV